MPAYRSSAEAEVRDAVVARLRQARPQARIIHEINVAGTGSNRIDVLAVDRAEIIAVEVKSMKDKLDRLPDQINAMRSVSHHVIAALHEKHLVWKESRTIPDHKWLERPPEARGADVWAFPEAGAEQKRGWGVARWDDPRPSVTQAPPYTALNMLWHEELLHLCRSVGMVLPKRPNMAQMTSALKWNATGAQITKGVCAALRARNCVEADEPVMGAA